MSLEPSEESNPASDPHVQNAITYLDSYNTTLRGLLSRLPKEKLEGLFKYPNPELATGPFRIGVCKDGVVARILNGFPVREGQMIVDDAHTQSMAEYFNSISDNLTRFFDPISKLTWPGNLMPIVAEDAIPEVMLMTFIIGGRRDVIAFPPSSKIIFIGTKCFEIDGPAFRAEAAASQSLTDAQGRANLQTPGAAHELLGTYRRLLNTASSEAELQTFLTAHPELVYPEYESVLPQPSLAGERRPDFAFSIRSAFGPRWIFVEIERPDKPVFTKGISFQFASEFTQAKGQLLEWDDLIMKDHAFFQRRFEGLGKPEFHLIYGRDAELDAKRRGMLSAEFSSSSNRTFSTFDDLANRFEKIVERIFRVRI